MSATGELLNAAKALLAGGKSVGAAARTDDGTPCDPFDKDAATYSMYGALQRAAYERHDSTGVDTALLLLGANDLQDPRMDGTTKALSDEDIGKRFDDAIERANGGPVKARSFDAEKRMLDPNDPDYAKKVRELQSNTPQSLGTTGAEEKAQTNDDDLTGRQDDQQQ